MRIVFVRDINGKIVRRINQFPEPYNHKKQHNS